MVDLAVSPGRDLDAVLEPGDLRLGLPGGAARHDEAGVARPLHDRRLQPRHYLGSLELNNGSNDPTSEWKDFGIRQGEN